FLLPNPYRLIIDIHGKQNETLQDAASDHTGASAAPSTHPAESVENSAATPQSSPGGSTEVSSLPPMPVTDGSAGFGLPTRGGSSGSKQAVAQPRVIIPSK